MLHYNKTIILLKSKFKIAFREEKMGHNSYSTHYPKNPHCIVTCKELYQEGQRRKAFGEKDKLYNYTLND